ncbi:MAG: hypothetical protein J7K31_03235 [Candidatus Aenigmarchaeota archaeon]|nr:hypothetical protein [Candidatus Aenigmarchaeota archaeon]OYT57918.1 MAG: hypothetical protein B6U68_01070 [Candidatus Aenigmarchaeota archaeon ex4484_14]
MTTIEESAKSLNIRGVFLAAIVSALSFVAALFWRDAISATIDAIIPKGHGLIYKYLAAFIVTILAAISIYLMYRAEKLREEEFFRKLRLLGRKRIKIIKK